MPSSKLALIREREQERDLSLFAHCRLAAEVERLQPLADRAAEIEAELEAYKEELAVIRSSQAAFSPEEVINPFSPK